MPLINIPFTYNRENCKDKTAEEMKEDLLKSLGEKLDIEIEKNTFQAPLYFSGALTFTWIKKE